MDKGIFSEKNWSKNVYFHRVFPIFEGVGSKDWMNCVAHNTELLLKYYLPPPDPSTGQLKIIFKKC